MQRERQEQKLRTYEHLILGGAAGAVAASVTMPLDLCARLPSFALLYSDAKVANRDIRAWHFVIENGYRVMDKSKIPRHKVR